MEEKGIVPIMKEEIVFSDTPSVIIRKSKRRKKPRKRLKRLISCLIFFAVLGLGIYKLPEILAFFQDNTQPEATDTTKQDNISLDVSQKEEKYEHPFVPVSVNEFTVSNETSVPFDFDLNSYTFLKKAELYESFSDTSPIVLIVHFAPSEGYSNNNGYSSGDSFYNENYNVAEIGRIICQRLNQNGINAIHISSYDYNGALYNSREAYEKKVKEVLEENPSISYIFDISRAVNVNKDLSIQRPYTTVDGVDYPAIEIFCGSNQGLLTKEQEKGIFFAKELADYINAENKNLISGLTVSNYSLSQVFSCPALRVDIGSFATNFEDACRSAILFSDGISNYFNN